MGSSGQTVLDLGPYPGVSDAEFTVTGLTGIADTSQVEAVIQPADTVAGWTADGVVFNGDQIVQRGGSYVGDVATKTGILSLWAQINNISSLVRLYGCGTSTIGLVFTIQNGSIILTCTGPGGVNVDVDLRGTVQPTTDWVHYLASWDIGANVGSLYVNDVLIDSNINRAADETIGYGNSAWGGEQSTAFNGIQGMIAEGYFAQNQYLDMTVTANRRKFNQLTPGGLLLPVSLGTTGATPTGVAPICYIHIDHGEVASNLSLNRGTGGTQTWRINGLVPSFGRGLVMQPGHSIDEHILDAPKCVAYSPSTAGASMKIRLSSRDLPLGSAVNAPLICGKWNVSWAWA
jgi:hypothetical protein